MPTHAIEPNEQAILALHRVSTGSSVHHTKALIHIYRVSCALGDIDLVRKAEQEMYQCARVLSTRGRSCLMPPETWRK